MSESNILFAYYWGYEEEYNQSFIRIFGLDKNNKSVMLVVPDFTPYIYLELPDTINWNEYLVKKLKSYILSLVGKNKIIDCILMRKKRLYYANKTMSGEGKLVDKKFPYLFLSMVTKKDIMYLSYKIERELKNMLHIQGLPVIKTKIHEIDASPVLQLTTLRDIHTAGWISFKGTPVVNEEDRESDCDYEYIVNSKNLKKSTCDSIVNPIIMGVDIEVNSMNPNVFPKAHIQGNKIFQIACVLCRQGDPESLYKKYLLTLGNPRQSKTGEDVIILSFKTETKMLEGYAEFIREHNPQIIVGYNIFSFDIPYMIDRAKLLQCIYNFDQQGCLKDKHGVEKKIKWSSAAYKNQEFQYLDCAGRLFVDLLPLVQRDYKFDNYKLKTISTHFLGQTKDPLSVKGIFKCYRIFSPDSLAICGKYCIQDSALVVKLFDVLQTWYGLCEMANTCNVPIFYLYTQGQQIKAYSQIYKKCTYEGFVVEKDGYICSENERYTGAYVFDPETGLYDMDVSFDFSSMYPSTIIAYNIDYSTLVKEDTIPDELCNVFEWTDHFGCEHDTAKRKTKISNDKIICGHNKYRFLKEPMGVIPTLLQNLLDARKKTNKEIARLKETRDKSLQSKIDVLDKRQLAYKISANSMYGCMGVKKGYLPFMPGAMCTTARGRESIQKAATYLQKEYKAKLIYGDTDSTYISLPGFVNESQASDCYNMCYQIEGDVKSLFPSPMKLAFEEKIYWRFFILTKKRYMALTCNTEGKVSTNMFKRGVLLARRDNSAFLRNIYSEVIDKVFYKQDQNNVLNHIVDRLKEMCSNRIDKKQFIITKSVGNLEDYKVKPLPEDDKKKEKRLKDLNCTEHEYKIKSLPAHVQLAEKMKNRGKPVDSGTRLEYVVTCSEGEKLFDKLEDAEYFLEHQEIIRLDYMYYLKLASNPLDQLLEVAYKINNFTLNFYKQLSKREKILNDIRNLGKTHINIIEH